MISGEGQEIITYTRHDFINGSGNESCENGSKTQGVIFTAASQGFRFGFAPARNSGTRALRKLKRRAKSRGPRVRSPQGNIHKSIPWGPRWQRADRREVTVRIMACPQRETGDVAPPPGGVSHFRFGKW